MPNPAEVTSFFGDCWFGDLKHDYSFKSLKLSGEAKRTKKKATKDFPALKQTDVNEEVGYTVHHVAVLVKQVPIKNECLEGPPSHRQKNSLFKYLRCETSQIVIILFLLLHSESQDAILPKCTSTSKLQVFFKVECHFYYSIYRFLNL